MKRICASIRDENSGAIMIEATIIIIITIMILLAMIAIGFMIYQQAMMNTVACEVASGIAASYKYQEREDFKVTTVPQSSIQELKKYRFTFAKGAMEREYEVIGEEYGKTRIAASSFGFNVSDPKISVDLTYSGVGRMHTEVVVSQKVNTLFDGALIYFGILDEKHTYSAYASAECMDVTSFMGNVRFFDYLGALAQNEGKAIADIIDKVIKAVNNIKELFA